MSANTNNIDYQEQFLSALKTKKTPIYIYLVNGIKLQGIIKAFDEHTILIGSSPNDSHGITQVVFKSAISTVCMVN